MGWRVIYIEESEYLNLYLDNLKVKKNSQDLLIPLKDIHTLIIDNYKAVLSINLINKCSEENINLILCGLDHMPITTLLPLSGNNKTPLILRKQFAWSDEVKQFIQMMIVKAKISNQIAVLKKHKKNVDVISRVKRFIDEVNIGDTTNREGLSAKMYFRELFGDSFTRFEEDVINAGLNYGYSILRSQISKVILGKGLNPSIGLFHHGPENMFNLSDDIIEVFRPIIDDWVISNLKEEKIFKREHRLELIKLTTKKYRYNNEDHTFFNVVNMYVSNLLEYIEKGEVNNLVFPKFEEYDI